jgi:crotonobetainyl-CoA:carnitine CoA-transferase CaiB-like acyl-CoA transferase
MVVELDQPGVEEPVRQLGVPVKLSRTPGGVHSPAPGLGEDTVDVLEALGYSPDEAKALHDDGAVAGPPQGAQGSFLA